MAGRLAGVATLSLLLAACSPAADTSETAEAKRPVLAEEPNLPPVPEEIVGNWELVAEECDDSSEYEPRPADELPEVTISLSDDWTYSLSTWLITVDGSFDVDEADGRSPVVSLEDEYFILQLSGGQLQIWGEGDAAVYVCGYIFDRTWPTN